MLQLSEPKIDVFIVTLARIRPGLVDHFRGHINAYYLSVNADDIGSEETIKARARTKVKHRLAFFQRGQCGGIAAAKAKICPFWH